MASSPAPDSALLRGISSTSVPAPSLVWSFEAPWSPPRAMPEAVWILIRPGAMIALFVAGWGLDVLVLTWFRVDYSAVLGLSKEELLSPQRAVLMAICMVLVLRAFSDAMHGENPGPTALGGLLAAYTFALVGLFIWLPASAARRARWRDPLARALLRCFWPAPDREVPFVEVMVADGLTSLAKVFFDLATGTCVALHSGVGQFTQGNSSVMGISLGVNQTREAGGLLAPASSGLDAAIAECQSSYVPYWFWALPFLIRAQQCLVSSRNSSDTLSRNLHLVNLAKYMSAMPVIFFAWSYAQSNDKLIQDASLDAKDFEAMWAAAAVVNAVFSFMWDMVMDWGLMQAAPMQGRKPGPTWPMGLRPVLLFRNVWGFYYISIGCNLLGRTLWSLRWSEQATSMLGGFFLSTLQQAAEVTRRCLWNVLRVEWECIKKGVHCSDKHFAV